MRPIEMRFFYFVLCIFEWSTILPGCSTAPQVFTISSSSDDVAPPHYGNKDYTQTMAAIASVMSHGFKLPVVNVSVTVYQSQVSYELGVVAEAVLDRERLQQRLGSGGKATSGSGICRYRAAVSGQFRCGWKLSESTRE